MGRDGGLCRGLGGSMHLVDAEHGFMGATGVVGGNIPIALGSALAARLRGEDSVAVVFFGDGAVQAGHFNETVNLAALWKLPLILVCENNGFAEFTPRSAHTNVERVSDVVAPYDVERDDRRRQRRRSRCGTRSGGFLALGARGRRPVPARVPDPPPARALRGRSAAQYREALADADWQAEGSDPAAAAARRRAGLVRRGRAGGDRGRGRRRRSRQAVRFARESPFPPRRADRGAGLRRWLRRPTSRRSPRRSPTAMRADERVFVLGEDVAEGGPYTATAGLAEEFGTRARDQHADQRGGDHRRRDRRGAVGPAPRARDHVHRLHHARARPARQRAPRRRTSCPAAS